MIGRKLTFQQKELLEMCEELRRDMDSPNSPLQCFLKYSPDALHHLLNR